MCSVVSAACIISSCCSPNHNTNVTVQFAKDAMLYARNTLLYTYLVLSVTAQNSILPEVAMTIHHIHA